MANKGVNKVILVGHLGADPEVKYGANGSCIANISLATSESWKDKATGEQREKTEWHRVVFFGKLAEIVGEYLRKGSQVYIEGKLQTRKWQDQSGQDRYSTEVVVDIGGEMQMLGSKPQAANAGGQAQQGAHQPRQQAAAPRQAAQQGQAPAQAAAAYSEPPMDFDDDIPFAPIGLQYRALPLCM